VHALAALCSKWHPQLFTEYYAINRVVSWEVSCGIFPEISRKIKVLLRKNSETKPVSRLGSFDIFSFKHFNDGGTSIMKVVTSRL